MKKKYRKIPRWVRIDNLQTFILAIDKLIMDLEKHNYMQVTYTRKEVTNQFINILQRLNVLKWQYNPPYVLQVGHYEDPGSRYIRDNSFMNRDEEVYTNRIEE